MRHALPVVVLLIVACSPTVKATPDATRDPAAVREQRIAHDIKQYGGLRGAYLAIYTETDCAMLDKDLATAQANKTLGFELAVGDREDELGCQH